LALELFKYLGPDAIGIIADGHVRFGKPSTFNDKEEMRRDAEWVGGGPLLDAIHNDPVGPGSTIDSAYALLHRQAERLVPGYRDYFDRLDKKIGVFCLTECGTDPHMWENYAQHRQGFVLGFDSTDEFFAPNPGNAIWECGVKPVGYAADLPVVNVPLSDEGLCQLCFTKRESWSCEREHRLIRAVPGDSAVTSAEYYSVPFPGSALTRVILGSCMTPGDRSRIIRDQNRNPEYASVRVFELVVHGDGGAHSLLEIGR
jgi:hypothetical protein